MLRNEYGVNRSDYADPFAISRGHMGTSHYALSTGSLAPTDFAGGAGRNSRRSHKVCQVPQKGDIAVLALRLRLRDR
jgi:hypothetical protein